MTISTIGYDDCSLTTDVAKIFTIVLTLGGIEKILAIATKVAQGLTRRRAEKKEKKKRGIFMQKNKFISWEDNK
jgi:hypothetical protein